MGNKNTKDIDAFNEGNLDGVNIAPGSHGQYLHPDVKREIMKQQAEYDRKKKEEKKKKKNGK